MKGPLQKLQSVKGRLALSAVMMLLSAVVALSNAPIALALQPNCDGGAYEDMGRYAFCGYFTNRYENTGLRLWNNGVPASVNSVNTFIAFVEAEKALPPGQGRTSAEFIIDTMEGLQPPNNARGQAWTLTTDWENKIIKGVAAGTLKISWFQSVSWRCGIEDTLYQPTPDDVAFYTTSTATAETPACGPGVTVPAIVFSDAKTGQVLYTIKRICGNPIGALKPLPDVDFNVTLTANRNGSPAQVIAGKSYTLGVGLANAAGPGQSDPGNLQVEYPGATKVISPCGGACSPAGTNALLFGDSPTHGYHNTSAIGGVGQPDWYWTVKALAKGASTSGTMAFTVSPGATPGTVITFDVYYSPGNLAGAVRHAMVSYTVVSERTPAVVGTNADAHAGGGICNLTSSNGLAQGYPGSGSGVQYVVSASAAAGINDFGSNGAVSGTAGDTLGLGKSGGYAKVCREDLLGSPNGAQAYYNAGIGGCIGGVGDFCTVAGTDFDVTGKSGVYFFTPASTVTVHGVISNKVTLVALAGNVTISGAVTIGGGVFAAHSAPSMGIIAKGTIGIPAGVTRVDAYLFADGAIDTCTNFATPRACATPQLVINGFIMGQTLEFHREGPFNADGSPVAEHVVMNPQIYLNPPKFFDASVDDLLLQGEGENQPLF